MLQILQSRVEWFLENILGTCHVVVDCSGTSNPKFYFDLLLFHPAHGKTRPQKTPKIPQKGLKSAKKILFDILKGFTCNKMCSLFFLRRKMKRNLKKYFFYYFVGQKPFSPFLKNKKNTKQPLILNYIFGNWSVM